MVLDSFSFDLLCKPEAEVDLALTSRDGNQVWNNAMNLGFALSQNADKAFSLYDLTKISFSKHSYSFSWPIRLDLGLYESNRAIRILYWLGIVKRKPFKGEWYYMIRPFWAFLFLVSPILVHISLVLNDLIFLGEKREDFDAEALCKNVI